ncbi:PREDICTED: proline-rich protein 15, partial [Calidris pugnax]|uniref:proline-rich protein 15 n=1 Tax=Calidris pugnax TaxID=198806 RepID=UPI00071DF943
AAATAAPHAGVKGSSAGPWWKSLTGKKKHKEAAATAPPPPAATTTEAAPAASPSTGGREEQPPPFGGGEAAGAGGSNRRGLRISHSGRFKERRKVRTSLLTDSPEAFDGGGACGHAAQGGE